MSDFINNFEGNRQAVNISIIFLNYIGISWNDELRINNSRNTWVYF